MARLLGLLALALASTVPVLAHADEAAQGKTVFQSTCAVCHMAAANGRTLIGPNLFGVVGRQAGSLPGFAYSSAMQKAGFVWTQEKITAFAQGPSRTVPGTKMPFQGLPSTTQAHAVAVYLASLH